METLQKKPTAAVFPEGHPMNNIKEIAKSLFDHVKGDQVLPVNKRRKMMRYLEKRKALIDAHNKKLMAVEPKKGGEKGRGNSLWDVNTKQSLNKNTETSQHKQDNPGQPINPRQPIGPRQPAVYTIRDKKIVKLEAAPEQETGESHQVVDAGSQAEEQLLEGTKMSVDDIRKILRFKDYEPGIPSKVSIYYKKM